MNPIYSQILYQFIAALFFAGSILAIVVGLGLLLRPGVVMRISEATSRWISPRSLLKPIERPRDAEPSLHRHRRLLGAAAVLGALFSIVGLLGVDEVQLARLMQGRHLPPQTAEIIAASAKWFLMCGNAVAALVGIGLLFFPELLARIESRANRWYSVRRHTRAIDAMHLGVDRWVQAHPRMAGSVMLAMGILIAASLGAIALGRN